MHHPVFTLTLNNPHLIWHAVAIKKLNSDRNETITILKTVQLPPTSFTSDFSFDDVTGCYALERKKVKGWDRGRWA